MTWSQRRQSASHFVQRLSKTQALRSYAFYLAQPSQNQAAQPAMGRIGIQPRVPEQPNRNLRRVDRKDKAVHHFAQVSGVSFGNTGDQIGRSSQGQRASSRSLPRLRDVLSHARSVRCNLRARQLEAMPWLRNARRFWGKRSGL